MDSPDRWQAGRDAPRAAGGALGVTIDAAFGYGKIVQKAVDEAGELRAIPEVIAAVKRGYAELLKVEKRLEIVDRESRPKIVSTPMGGRLK